MRARFRVCWNRVSRDTYRPLTVKCHTNGFRNILWICRNSSRKNGSLPCNKIKCAVRTHSHISRFARRKMLPRTAHSIRFRSIRARRKKTRAQKMIYWKLPWRKRAIHVLLSVYGNVIIESTCCGEPHSGEKRALEHDSFHFLLFHMISRSVCHALCRRVWVGIMSVRAAEAMVVKKVNNAADRAASMVRACANASSCSHTGIRPSIC